MSKQKKHKTALNEVAGVFIDKKAHSISLDRIKSKRNKVSTEKFVDGILSGNISILSKAITLIESTNSKHQEQSRDLIKQILPYSGKSIRIGITGVPGAGKSTFIETFGNHLTEKGHRVAILAVDPSSSLSKGSILGDKTRMESLVQNPKVYIRPSASGDSLGGVAKKTRESILLCEAAGYDVLLIETVGVGQSETAVHAMVDFFLLIKLAGAGDELQGIKRGIIEMADSIVINKADGDNINAAHLAKNAFENALHLYPLKDNKWQPQVVTCSALKDKGVTNVIDLIEHYITLTKANGSFDKKRLEQEQFWLYDRINEQLKSDFFNNPIIKEELTKQLSLLAERKTTPYEITDLLFRLKT